MCIGNAQRTFTVLFIRGHHVHVSVVACDAVLLLAVGVTGVDPLPIYLVIALAVSYRGHRGRGRVRAAEGDHLPALAAAVPAEAGILTSLSVVAGCQRAVETWEWSPLLPFKIG